MKIRVFASLLLSLLATLVTHAQKTDTIIDAGVYKSYFSYDLKQPLYVTYHLYRGGGNCDRGGMGFRKCGIQTATDRDYANSDYEKGHLANAEDFAFDCEKLKTTFCYYNALPQKEKLNTGIWKAWEEKTRELSRTRKLFIIVGGIYSSTKIGPNKVGVPDYCYRIVMLATTKKIVWCQIFPNDTSNTYQEISLSKLKKRLGYKLVPYK